MASRKARLLAALCALAILAAFNGDAESASCCLRYSKRMPPCRRLLNYTIQTADASCDIFAVIFHVPGRFVCANPHSAWVQRRMMCVDERRTKRGETLRGNATIQ